MLLVVWCVGSCCCSCECVQALLLLLCLWPSPGHHTQTHVRLCIVSTVCTSSDLHCPLASTAVCCPASRVSTHANDCISAAVCDICQLCLLGGCGGTSEMHCHEALACCDGVHCALVPLPCRNAACMPFPARVPASWLAPTTCRIGVLSTQRFPASWHGDCCHATFPVSCLACTTECCVCRVWGLGA